LRKIFLLSCLASFLVTLPTHAAFAVPYIVYTLENFDPGEGAIAAVPHHRYLFPHIYNDQMESGPDPYVGFILKRLTDLKPSLYRGTRLVKTIPDKFPLKRVVINTKVRDKRNFMIMASELTCSLSASFDKFDRVIVIFHFKDKKLEEDYGGQEFTYEDLPYSAFILRIPNPRK
jgi:hypothetical protein